MNRKRRLALVGAALLAALAAAALIFRAGGPQPSEKDSAQEVSISAPAGNENDHRATAAPDTIEGGGQETEPPELDPRLDPILNSLYQVRGIETNSKIHDFLVWYGTKMIADGEEEEDIAMLLSAQLITLRLQQPEDLDGVIQTTRDDVLGIKRSGWEYDPRYSKKMNRIHKYFYDKYGSSNTHRKEDGRTPRAVIEILVEGMDNLTAAEYLYNSNWGIGGEKWPREREYAIEYANRVLAKDPTSSDALILKADANVDAVESARLLVKHYPDDERAIANAASDLEHDYPEEAIAAISRILPEDGLHSDSMFHILLGNSYERLDMLYEAADQFQKAYAAGNSWASYRYNLLERGERAGPSIWEERAAAAEAAAAPPQPAEASGQPTQRPPDAPTPPETPPSIEPPPPPPDIEAEMSAAYADFAKAYQGAFEMEYSLSEATPEGYMNALLGMARAFARAGDAKRGQDAYNAARKRYSPEEIQQAFRRFDEQDRLRREASNDEEDDSEDE